MDLLEHCPECGAELNENDMEKGYCRYCDCVFEEDTGDLLDDLERDENDKLGDAFYNQTEEE